MTDHDLENLALRIRASGIPIHFEPEKARLLIAVWRRLAAGEPVSLQEVREIAQQQGLPEEPALAFIEQLSERNEEGDVVGLFGLSQKEHPHRFFVGEKTFSTWCAWDALFLPPMLQQTARVESFCPATHEKITLTLAPERVQHFEPSGTVLSMIVPETSGAGFGQVEEVWRAFCCHVHFFKSPEVASEWFAGKNQTPLFLTVEQGYRLGKLTFKELLEYV